ncbi:MAG: extracellular solute-binding protein [Chloroflexota bacterium]
MKRSFSLVLVLVLVTMFALPGLAAQAQEVTITFLTPPWGVPPNEEALAAFQAETGIKVDVQSVQMNDLFSRVQVAAAAGEAPADVIFLSEEAPSNIVATGNMLPLNDLIEATPELNIEDVERLDFFTLDGNVYGITTYLQMVMMDYNAERLAAAGFDAPPTTWQELRDMAVAIKEQGVDPYPISFGATDWSWYLMALSMGDPMFDEDLNPVFADEGSKAREAMAMLLDFFKDELISPEMLATPTTPHAIFWSGVGVFHQGWQGSVAVGNNPDVSQHAPNVKYMALPEVGNTWSFPAGIGISVDSKNVEAAWKFIQWYVSPETQQDIYKAFGLYPSRISAQEALNEAGAIDGYDVISAQAQHIHELPRYVLWWGPFAQFATETIYQAILTGGDPDRVIDTLADEWNSLKEEYGE